MKRPLLTMLTTDHSHRRSPKSPFDRRRQRRRLVVNGALFLLLPHVFLFAPNLCRAEVVTLTDANFDELTLSSSSPSPPPQDNEGSTAPPSSPSPTAWFILFKTEWCVHCRKMKPDFERLSDDPELQQQGIQFGTIDASVGGRSTASRFNVETTPALILIKDGRYYNYIGQRAFYAMKKFVSYEYEYRRSSEVPPPLVGKVGGIASRGGTVGFIAAVSLEIWNALGHGLKYVGYVVGGWFALMSVVGLVLRIKNWNVEEEREDDGSGEGEGEGSQEATSKEGKIEARQQDKKAAMPGKVKKKAKSKSKKE